MAICKKIAFIGNSPPRRCGIATFTGDLSQAMSAAYPQMECAVIAMTDKDQSYAYPSTVTAEIHEKRLADYIAAADLFNAGGYDVVSLQHEFGIFGGEAGGHIMALLSRLKMPVVTTLHTVLSDPTPAQRRVLQKITAASSRIIVMANKGRELLETAYGVPLSKVDVIAHGIPDVPFSEPEPIKAKLGFEGKAVILTFGLLSPNKGIEVVIDAMPQILHSCPDAVYVVLGATHPNLVREQGEAYRQSLQARAQALGVSNAVIFLDQFVDLPRLLDFISMCDVYVTPYLDEAQMTSGTLAYSFGLGKAVVSTPYWHARELLADGHGVLVAFNDAPATGRAIADLLNNTSKRQAMRMQAYACSRSMTWERTAEKYMACFSTAGRSRTLRLVVPEHHKAFQDKAGGPELNLGHFLAMSDDTGIFQHAIYNVPDRAHGYCVDDNARALILACNLHAAHESPVPDTLTAVFAAFVQHAWNPDTGRFRNFMGFSRNWLEDQGSEDSHGRTLWALGVCAGTDKDRTRRAWAMALFPRALEAVEGFSSPRAWAFTLLGLDGYCAVNPDDTKAQTMRLRLAERLMTLYHRVATAQWTWLERGLSYDNARLCQALILTGNATGSARYSSAGLQSLGWLMAKQTTENGHFRPIGTDGFFDIGEEPRPFDQQPVEATAMISACLAAWRQSDDTRWKDSALMVFDWFTGRNDLSTSLVDTDTGACRDGLHADRANENRGAESVICLLMSSIEIRQIARLHSNNPEHAKSGLLEGRQVPHLQ